MNEQVIVTLPGSTSQIRAESGAPTAVVSLPGAQGSGTGDHSALANLDADDHPQYALTDGSRGEFEPTGAVAAHAAAPDPHPQYLGQADVVAGPGVTVTADPGGSVTITAEGDSTAVGPYYLNWNGVAWEDVQTGGTVTARPVLPAWPTAWVVWITVEVSTYVTPPPLAVTYDMWAYHKDAILESA